MAAPRIRADYDQLDRIIATFARHSSLIRRIEHQVTRQVDTLAGGDWVGPGAQAFYREMEGEVLPSLARLAQGLDDGQATTVRIKSIIQDAEREAALLLSGGQLMAANSEPGLASGQGFSSGPSYSAFQETGSQFPEFEQLSPTRQQLLRNSFNGTVEITTGGAHLTYEGVKDPGEFYKLMQREHPRELANFLNQTAVLDSVKFEDGTTALSYVSRVSEFRQDRIMVDLQELKVAGDGGEMIGLKSQLDRLQAASVGEKPFIGPRVTPAHGDFSETYRENVPVGAQQISFNPADYRTADIDIDYYNPEAGKAIEHGVLEVLPNTVLGTKTDPHRVYEILDARGDIQLDYELPDR